MKRFVLVIAAALLAGCSQSSRLVPQTATDFVRSPGSSLMAPDIANADLLYISDGNGEVVVYRYWQHTFVGVLTDFTQPMGECVDTRGDVFITDYAAKQVVEYAHGATKPYRKLDDAPYTPYACAVDPTSGNLAVANSSGGTGESGNIAIYGDASGQPTYYTDPQISAFEGCAYDAKGDLLVTNGGAGRDYSSFAWLRKGATALANINLPGPTPSYEWNDVAGIQWDGKYWAIDEYEEALRENLIEGQMYYVGYTAFDCCGAYGPLSIYNNGSGQGTQAVAAVEGSVEYFNYPAGGDPIAYISHGIDEPYGVAISLKSK
jgi:hypothetical protein